ncbi:hypothetical protein [Kutzneria sp. CA-103260]|uniref:hypothetical protein n=1 Tax=Kutzneria sp. CA-103260 TaxID=2802641 RepID=UPI001BAE5455|nr:hypothetical protein [Kutzneria sp. CA-103260]QUQ69373.1 hypothetical protein JJ691_71310 [Kutzneria sp. CA-103260]
MEFKTSGYWIVAETGANPNACLVIAIALWVLACSQHDAMLVACLRAVLVLAVKFVKAGFAAVAPRRRRRSHRPRRRG